VRVHTTWFAQEHRRLEVLDRAEHARIDRRFLPADACALQSMHGLAATSPSDLKYAGKFTGFGEGAGSEIAATQVICRTCPASLLPSGASRQSPFSSA
jgi:hypothetical protein